MIDLLHMVDVHYRDHCVIKVVKLPFSQFLSSWLPKTGQARITKISFLNILSKHLIYYFVFGDIFTFLQ